MSLGRAEILARGKERANCVYSYDGRALYSGQSWECLYMSSDDKRYLQSCSVIGYTEFDG
jgi:hypothetical protein